MNRPRQTTVRKLLPVTLSSPSPRLKVRPVVRTTISDEIVDQIMGLIASGHLKPG